MAYERYIICLTPTNSNWVSEWKLNNKEKHTILDFSRLSHYGDNSCHMKSHLKYGRSSNTASHFPEKETDI